MGGVTLQVEVGVGCGGRVSLASALRLSSQLKVPPEVEWRVPCRLVGVRVRVRDWGGVRLRVEVGVGVGCGGWVSLASAWKLSSQLDVPLEVECRVPCRLVGVGLWGLGSGDEVRLRDLDGIEAWA